MRRTVDAYLEAKHTIICAGYAREIDWQCQVAPDRVTEPEFLGEAAWVILSTGFRETTVRTRFAAISAAFYDWEDAQTIHRDAERCIASALPHFNNGPKIRAIASLAGYITAAGGFSRLWSQVRTDPLQYLIRLPYIGPTTSCHLAKNLGFDVVKPDRHLVRVAAFLRWETVDQMCAEVAAVVGDKVSVIDLVFWRFATLSPDYLARLGEGT